MHCAAWQTEADKQKVGATGMYSGGAAHRALNWTATRGVVLVKWTIARNWPLKAWIWHDASDFRPRRWRRGVGSQAGVWLCDPPGRIEPVPPWGWFQGISAKQRGRPRAALSLARGLSPNMCAEGSLVLGRGLFLRGRPQKRSRTDPAKHAPDIQRRWLPLPRPVPPPAVLRAHVTCV